MTATACPYCNALSGFELQHGRVVCKRCGEAIETSPDVTVESSTPSPAAMGRRTRKWVMPLLGLLVVTGVILAAWQPWVQSSPNPTRSSALIGIVRPAEIAGLGYLPEATDAILVVQLPAFLETLGPDTRDDPAQALMGLGLPESAVRTIDAMSGVGLRQAEQLILGLGFAKSALPPQAVLVLRTRDPFDVGDLDQRTKSSDFPRDGRTLHKMRGGPMGEVIWWAPDDRTLVVTLLAKDFAEVPMQPRTGIDHLRPELRSLIRDQLAETACVWLAADSDKWNDHLWPYTLPLAPLQGRGDVLKPAARLRTVALSYPAVEDAQVDCTIALKSADAATALRRVYAERFAGEPAEVGGSGETVRIQAPRDAAQVGSMIGRLIGPKP